MRQFSVCLLRRAPSTGRDRLVVVIQHDALSSLRTRLVAPLLSGSELDFVDKLTPRTLFNGSIYLIALNQMATVDMRTLGPSRGEIDAHDVVMRGIDLLVTGF